MKTQQEFLEYFRRICDINTKKNIAIHLGITNEFINNLYEGKELLTSLNSEHLRKLGYKTETVFKNVGCAFDDSTYEEIMEWRKENSIKLESAETAIVLIPSEFEKCDWYDTTTAWLPSGKQCQFRTIQGYSLGNRQVELFLDPEENIKDVMLTSQAKLYGITPIRKIRPIELPTPEKLESKS